MRWVRGASAVMLVAVSAVGCGGSGGDKGTSSKGEKDDKAAAVASQDAGGTAGTGEPAGADERSATTTTTAKAGGGTEEGKPKGAAASGMPSQEQVGEPDGSELPSEPLPMEVTLSSTCVRPGTPLTVTVKTSPKAQLGYDTTWADGKTGWDAPNRGGTAKGAADEAGTWKNTATIGADAPKGTAKVDVIGADALGHMGRRTVEYQVSDALGKCS